MNSICVVGAGSVGMLVAGKLAAAGQDVTLLTRTKEQANCLRERGLTINSEAARICVHMPVYAIADTGRHVRQQTYDWVLLTVKQFHLEETLLQHVSELLGDHGKLLCFQNGIGHEDKLMKWVPVDRLYIATTTEGAKKQSMHEVAHTGTGTTWIGLAHEPDQQKMSNKCDDCEKNIILPMQAAGFHTLLSKKMKEMQWQKLLINAVINPLTALLDVPNGALPATADSVRLMRQLLTEAEAVARAVGVAIRDGMWEQVVDVCQRTAQNRSSMLQDLSTGKQTEIDAISGQLLSLAAAHHIAMPVTETVYACVKAAELLRRR